MARLVIPACYDYDALMDREPGDFFREEPAASSESEDAVDRLLARLPPAPGIKHIDEDDTHDIAEALADVAAGRCYDHSIVSRWLMTWGEAGRKPFKDWLADQDG